MADLLRLYEPNECGKDGYPLAWHRGGPAIKDLVRELAGHRCVRCQHPFVCGETPGEWSPCDGECSHGTPIRRRQFRRDPWQVLEILPPAFPGELNLRLTAGQRVRGKELVEARWRVLTVHHLIGEKRDCRPFNLCCLCQRCHLSVQSRVRMAQVYPHEHSAWFKPFAAAYYAQVYLGETLTLEEASGRFDELLALERVVV